MKRFRLPRKIKKKINGFYLYPMDPVRRTYLMAHPKENQEDYDAYRSGVLNNMLDEIKKRNHE